MHYGIFLGNSLDHKETIILDLVCLIQVKFMTDWILSVVLYTSLPVLCNLIYVWPYVQQNYKTVLLMDGKTVS